MVRLSFDAEMWRRGISTAPLPPDVRAEIESDLRGRLLALVAAGADVVLDFSFWSRRMRDDYRRLLEPTGVVPTIYLATDRETVLDRMLTRRGHHCDDYVLPDDVVREYFDHFEPRRLARARSRSFDSRTARRPGGRRFFTFDVLHPATAEDGVATFDPSGLPGVLGQEESLGGEGCPPVGGVHPRIPGRHLGDLQARGAPADRRRAGPGPPAAPAAGGGSRRWRCRR